VIPILLIVVIVLILVRASRRPAVAVDGGISERDPIRMILLVIIVLLLIGLAATLFMPLGKY
jgi:hypothetical protein